MQPGFEATHSYKWGCSIEGKICHEYESTYQLCIRFLSTVMMKNKSTTTCYLENNDFSWAYNSQAPVQQRGKVMARTQGKTWRQEQKQRPRTTVAWWLAPYSFHSLMSYNISDHLPKGETRRSCLDSPHQSLINKMHLRIGLQAVWWSHLLNWCFFFSDGFGAYQGDKINKLTNQHIP